MEFRDLFELATRATRYESVLLDEQEMRNSSKGTYCKDSNYAIHVAECEFKLGEVDMAKVISKWPIICSTLSKPVNNNSVVKKQVLEAEKN